MFRKVIFIDTIKLMLPVAAAMTLLFSATTAGLCTELAQALERKRPGSSENDKKEELKPLPSAVKTAKLSRARRRASHPRCKRR